MKIQTRMIASICTGQCLFDDMNTSDFFADMIDAFERMCGIRPKWWQLIRFADEATPQLQAQFPQVAAATPTTIDTIVDQHGTFLDVAPIHIENVGLTDDLFRAATRARVNLERRN